MNIDQIKARLNQMNKTGDQAERPDYSKIFWKPENGKNTIRIVPSTFNPEYPFTELRFHYGISKFPMLALSNFGEQDPIEAFIKELKKTSDKDNWSLAGKLSPKTRIFAPIIVRGEEEKGVRLWSFGITIYKALLALAEDEDVGDFTDITNGWDMVVDLTPSAGPGQFPSTSVRIKPKQSALSSDSTAIEEWLKTQPKPIESFGKVDYEFMKKQLQLYLDPEAKEEAQPAAGSEPAEAGLPLEKALPIMGTPKAVKPEPMVLSKSKTFDDLFNE